MRRRIRLSESSLHRIIKESVRRILRENEKREVFSIYGFNVDTDEGVDDMQYCGQVYYSEEEAIEAARECAQKYADYSDDVLIFTVYGGEYEDGRGNTYGESYDIYSISTQDEQTTMEARKASGFVRHEVDEYVG